MPWHYGAGTTVPRLMGLKCPTWMPTGRWSWTIWCEAGFKQDPLSGSCTPWLPVAQNPGDNSGTCTSNLFLKLRANWQQRQETPALIRRIHTSSSDKARLKPPSPIAPNNWNTLGQVQGMPSPGASARKASSSRRAIELVKATSDFEQGCEHHGLQFPQRGCP